MRALTFRIFALVMLFALPARAFDTNARAAWVYDVATGTLSADRTRSGNILFGPLFPSVESVRVPLRAGALDLDVYVDTTSVEVFAQRGTHAITDLVFPNPSSTAISVDSDGGRTHLDVPQS